MRDRYLPMSILALIGGVMFATSAIAVEAPAAATEHAGVSLKPQMLVQFGGFGITNSMLVTWIEFDIPKPPNWTSICGFNETPSCPVVPASAAKVEVASIALEANTRIDISKQRLRIL